MTVFRATLCLPILALFPLSTVLGQTLAQIENARRKIEALEIDSAVAELQTTLAQRDHLTQQQRVRGNVLLGIAELIRGRRDNAQAAFHEALWLNPDERIDSLSHLSSALRDAFAREKGGWSSMLRVTTEPTGAEILIGARTLGRAPLERRVPTETILNLRAVGSTGVTTVAFAMPTQRLVSVHVRIPDDTMPTPIEPSRASLLRQFTLASQTEWSPGLTPLPAVPPPDSIQFHGGRNGGIFLSVVLTVVCATLRPDENKPGTCPAPKAILGVAPTSFVLGWIFGSQMVDDSRRRVAEARFQKYMKDLQQREALIAPERDSWIEQRIAANVAELRQRRDEIVRQNATIRARNAAIAEPRITVERFPDR